MGEVDTAVETSFLSKKGIQLETLSKIDRLQL